MNILVQGLNSITWYSIRRLITVLVISLLLNVIMVGMLFSGLNSQINVDSETKIDKNQ